MHRNKLMWDFENRKFGKWNFIEHIFVQFCVCYSGASDLAITTAHRLFILVKICN